LRKKGKSNLRQTGKEKENKKKKKKKNTLSLKKKSLILKLRVKGRKEENQFPSTGNAKESKEGTISCHHPRRDGQTRTPDPANSSEEKKGDYFSAVTPHSEKRKRNS